jgi:hypothetical protein
MMTICRDSTLVRREPTQSCQLRENIINPRNEPSKFKCPKKISFQEPFKAFKRVTYMSTLISTYLYLVGKIEIFQEELQGLLLRV